MISIGGVELTKIGREPSGTVRRTRRVVFDFRRNSWLEWASEDRNVRANASRAAGSREGDE